jgi:hypothetical protein
MPAMEGGMDADREGGSTIGSDSDAFATGISTTMISGDCNEDVLATGMTMISGGCNEGVS